MVEKVKMIDITMKDIIYREAIAEGRIILRPETIRLIKDKKIEKGDVEAVATTAAILAVKKTPETLPLCHPIPIHGIRVKFDYDESSVKVTVEVKSKAETGVEMEALTGVSVALLTIWDMVKKYEKDEEGQYPYTRITDIRVVRKMKHSLTKEHV